MIDNFQAEGGGERWLLWRMHGGIAMASIWYRDPRTSIDWKTDIEPTVIGSPQIIPPDHPLSELSTIYPPVYPKPGNDAPGAAVPPPQQEAALTGPGAASPPFEGHAFPSGDGQYGGGQNHDYGMTLRDYLAAQAMQGYLAAGHHADIAAMAYRMADAMIEARKR